MIYYIIYSFLKSPFLTFQQLCRLQHSLNCTFFSFSIFSNGCMFFSVFQLLHLCISLMELEKMDGSSFYAYHSEFYLVQVYTHTDFGDLMQQLDHRTRKGRGIYP